MEERAFIPISESFEFLKRDLSKLSYVNENNELFLLLAQKLYCVNIENNTYEVLEDGIKMRISQLPKMVIMQHGW